MSTSIQVIFITICFFFTPFRMKNAQCDGSGFVKGETYGKMPAEKPIFETGPQNPVDPLPNAQGEEEKRTYLRMADFSVKSRTLLETDYAEYKIIYRRVKRINELVVNGMVYGEYDSLIECAHNLSTVLNGNLIEAGYTGVYSYIKFNGTTIAKKLRL